MTTAFEHAQRHALVRPVVLAIVAAQGAFWLYTLSLPRSGLAPIDLVVVWLTAPALLFAIRREDLALGAGLAVASLLILLGLLAA